MSEKIFCPRCGKAAGEPTSFCRTCGLALDGVSAIVSGDVQTAPTVTTRPNPTAIRFGIGLFILGTVLGLVNIILRDLHLFPEIYGKAVFLASVAAGLLTIGSSFVFPQKKYTPRTGRSRQPQKSSPEFETVNLENALPDGDASIFDINPKQPDRAKVLTEPGSVTERTTRKLARDDG